MGFLFLLVVIMMLDTCMSRPEEGEAAVLDRVKRGGCCICVCGKKKRSAEGAEIDHDHDHDHDDHDHDDHDHDYHDHDYHDHDYHDHDDYDHDDHDHDNHDHDNHSEEGLEIDHNMTKRFAAELDLLTHYSRQKRSPVPTPGCCCVCVLWGKQALQQQ